MFALSVVFGPTIAILLYKKKETADAAYQMLRMPNMGGNIEVADDYGQTLAINASAIIGLIYDDVNESKHGQVARMMHQEKTKLALMKAAQSDPEIKMAAAMAGPPVFSPINGGMRG